MSPLILASTSPYRAELLQRLRIPFEQIDPKVRETPEDDESAEKLAPRLARAKAEAVSRHHAGVWSLGSDQVAACLGRVLGKPGDRATACEQLSLMSGRSVAFVTALALINSDMPRPLSEAQITRYLQAEQPYDCAGSFKMEGLGITLFEEIQSRDPTGLQGLPLIATARLLRKAGYLLP